MGRGVSGTGIIAGDASIKEGLAVIVAWIKLKYLEFKLNFEFGKSNKYAYSCEQRGARSARERLAVAQEVWAGPGVNTPEAQAYALFLRQEGQRDDA